MSNCEYNDIKYVTAHTRQSGRGCVARTVLKLRLGLKETKKSLSLTGIRSQTFAINGIDALSNWANKDN